MKLFIVPFIIVGLVMTVGCSEDEPDPVPGEVVANVPTSADVGQTVTLTDNSEGVDSRTWTIQDGDPATSTAKTVNVSFTSQGDKTVTLEVVFENGTTNSATFTTNVQDIVTAEFNSSSSIELVTDETVTDYNYIDVAYAVQFSSTIGGSPDSFEWTFPDGTPESSTEENPVVTWNDEDAGVKQITLVVTRTSDNQSVTVQEEITVGKENLVNGDWWYDWSSGEVPAYTNWQAPGNWITDTNPSIETDGYKGNALKIDVPADATFWQIWTRDQTDANPQIPIPEGSVVHYSYYIKADIELAEVRYIRMGNNNPDVDFQGFLQHSPSVGTTWRRMSRVDTLRNYAFFPLTNLFPQFNVATPESPSPAHTIWIDEVSIKLLDAPGS